MRNAKSDFEERCDKESQKEYFKLNVNIIVEGNENTKINEKKILCYS